MKRMMQAKLRVAAREREADRGHGVDATRSVEAVIRSPGQPLPASVRSQMEPRFGTDFSAVRVHTGDEASRSASSIDARAYTARQHIVFGNGEYNPSTHEGTGLLAHELTHVMQQRQGIGADQVQRAQIGRVTTPAAGTPFFEYELDAARSTFAELGQHYGVTTDQIQTANPTARPTALRLGQVLRIPALNPPAAGSAPAGAGASSVVQSTATHGLVVRWSANGNKVGSIQRGRSVFAFPSGVDVPVPSIDHQAAGVIAEMDARSLVTGGMMLYGWMDPANIRAYGGATASSDVNLIARMIGANSAARGRAQ